MTNKIKVGDIFCSEWGYDQTNVSFFQVVELVGKKSIRVRQVEMEIEDKFDSTPMSANMIYKMPQNGELLPTLRYQSIFIKDNNRGDVKRVIDDGCGRLAIKLDSFAWAYLENPEKTTTSHFVSWYH